MMKTKKNSHWNCLICRLSGSRKLVVRRVQISGVSCVSHDAVRLVPGPNALLVSRATMIVLSASSVPVFGLFSRPLRPSLSQPCPRGLSLTCTRSLSHAVSPLWSSRRQSTMFRCQDLEQDCFWTRNNILRVISVTRCPGQCDATRSTCASRDTKSRMSPSTARSPSSE